MKILYAPTICGLPLSQKLLRDPRISKYIDKSGSNTTTIADALSMSDEEYLIVEKLKLDKLIDDECYYLIGDDIAYFALNIIKNLEFRKDPEVHKAYLEYFPLNYIDTDYEVKSKDSNKFRITEIPDDVNIYIAEMDDGSEYVSEVSRSWY